MFRAVFTHKTLSDEEISLEAQRKSSMGREQYRIEISLYDKAAPASLPARITQGHPQPREAQGRKITALTGQSPLE